MKLLDSLLDEPAKKAARQLRSSIKLHIGLIIAIWIIGTIIVGEGINDTYGGYCFFGGLVVVPIVCLYIRDSYLYKLAILDACQAIVERGVYTNRNYCIDDDSTYMTKEEEMIVLEEARRRQAEKYGENIT